MATILIVGAADTGRAPMASALLRRQLEARQSDHMVESAGVLGHDGDPATDEALKAMEQMNLDIGDHVARSLDDDMVARAALLIAVDTGSARVARARFPGADARLSTLGDLSGRGRDIPDPFKMQIGAWLGYAREIDDLLARALPHILELLGDVVAPVAPDMPPVVESEPALQPAAEPVLDRAPAVERMLQLLGVIDSMPGVVDWPAARARLLSELDQCMRPVSPGDAAPALAGMIRAALSMSAVTPSAAQLAALRDAAALLRLPVAPQAISSFSTVLTEWHSQG